MNTIGTIAATALLLGTVSGGFYFVEGRFATQEMVGNNSKAILLIRIQNAKQQGNMALFNDLCQDFRNLYGWRPKVCG